MLAALFAFLPTALSLKVAADYFVHSLPGAPEPLLKQYAGHVEIAPEHHGNLFFWLYENKHVADQQRTILWLNGGPGCSSMDGALMEIGPYRVGPGGNLTYNEGSWNEFANLLFVDNPLGTGFSYVDSNAYVHELDEMAKNMVTFLETWFTIFPQYKHDDLYIAGESYAGQYIPYVARAILDRNNEKSAHDSWNLKGLLIGNGWISGPEQYMSYLPFAYQAGIIQGGSEVAEQVEDLQKRCINALQDGGNEHVDTPTCEGILTDILRLTMDKNEATCFNMYDVRLRDSWPSCGMNWPPDLEHVTPYLRREDVKRAIHINPDKHAGWVECNGPVGSAFNARNSKPSVQLLPGLLEQIPIILFSGDKDFICNHIGTEDLISNLSWNNGTGFETSQGVWAPKRDWTFEGEPAGIYQEARNLTYIKFYNSSHMVPFDHPRRTRDMVDRFIGVSIGSIGGKPADSEIDGVEAGPSTSVGSSQGAEADKVSEATWRAYKRSGEVALVVVCIVVAVWGYFIWRDRRRRRGYAGVNGDDSSDWPFGGLGLNGYSDKRKKQRDIEAARDYDEAELDELTGGPGSRHGNDPDNGNFDLHDSDAEDEDNGVAAERANGSAH